MRYSKKLNEVLVKNNNKHITALKKKSLIAIIGGPGAGRAHAPPPKNIFIGSMNEGQLII